MSMISGNVMLIHALGTAPVMAGHSSPIMPLTAAEAGYRVEVVLKLLPSVPIRPDDWLETVV
jgi:hypothetical protein